MEEGFLSVARKKMDKIYRFALRIMPDFMALKICKAMKNRSLMQFEAQNRFLAKHGKSLVSYFLSTQYDCMTIREKEITISGFLELGAFYECIESELEGKEIIFYEEGLVQKTFMFLETGGIKGEYYRHLFSYLSNIPLPDLIIYVKTNVNLCHKRMVGRPEGLTDRLKKCSREEIINFLERGETHFQKMADWLNKNSKVRLIEVNNNEDMKKVVHYVKNEIISLS
jgi:hypothetical protein